MQRVFAFVKRLSSVSLQLMPGACLAVLATVRKCVLVRSGSRREGGREGGREGEAIAVLTWLNLMACSVQLCGSM